MYEEILEELRGIKEILEFLQKRIICRRESRKNVGNKRNEESGSKGSERK